MSVIIKFVAPSEFLFQPGAAYDEYVPWRRARMFR
jgi:hypothetical protein